MSTDDLLTPWGVERGHGCFEIWGEDHAYIGKVVLLKDERAAFKRARMMAYAPEAISALKALVEEFGERGPGLRLLPMEKQEAAVARAMMAIRMATDEYPV